MKRIIKWTLVFTLIQILNPVFSQQEDSYPIKVITYNIWYDNPENLENPWTERKKGIKNILETEKPDIFCVQEALDNQVQDLEILCYRHSGVGRDDGIKAGEYAAIFYDTLRFIPRDGGNFWLSQTPDTAGSMGWDAMCIRIVTWLKLQDRLTGNQFLVFNTHFDHEGDTARIESASLLISRINDISGSLPVIVTGDFNCGVNTEPYEIITSQKNVKHFRNSMQIAEHKVPAPDYSFVGSNFTGNPGEIIDFIFVSDPVLVIKAFILENCNNGKCPSDHLPVVAEILF